MSVEGLSKFTADLTRFQQEIMPGEHAKFCKRIAAGVWKDLINGTPVDTGLAKANWQATNGEAATGTIETTDKDGSATIAAALATIAAADPLKEIMYLTNNLPYIESLEDGHSKTQAPHGWVESALVKVKLQAEKI